MASTRRKSEKKGMAAVRLGTSNDSEEGLPRTAQREKPVTSKTLSSVEGRGRGEPIKTVTG